MSLHGTVPPALPKAGITPLTGHGIFSTVGATNMFVQGKIELEAAASCGGD